MIRIIVLALFVMIQPAVAESVEFKKHDLIGMWSYVETYTQFADGRKQPQFGDRPAGRFVILANGHYSHIIMDPNLPRVKSERFKQMTVEEAERISEGVLSHFGTWEADEKKGTFTVTIEKSSFPNFDGIKQVRTITLLTRESLSYVNNLSVAEPGAIVVAVLRRIR